MYGLIICLITLSALLFGLYVWCCIPPKSAEHKTIMESKLFKISLLAPIAFSLLSAAFIFLVIDGKFNFEISGIDSFKNFYEIFKIPLSLIAASPVTAGIAAIIHRSEETAKQIELSNKQYKSSQQRNNFENYTKHKDELEKTLTYLQKNTTYKTIKAFYPSINIYRRLFPNNNFKNFEPELQNKNLLITYNRMKQISFKMSKSTSMINVDDIKNLLILYNTITSSFNINFENHFESSLFNIEISYSKEIISSTEENQELVNLYFSICDAFIVLYVILDFTRQEVGQFLWINKDLFLKSINQHLSKV